MDSNEYEFSEDAARLRVVLDSMVEAVFVTDAKGRVTLTNQALDDLIERNVLGRRAKKVLRSKPLRSAIRRARRKNIATEVELETEIAGRVHTFKAQVSPLPHEAGAVAVLHDVTSLKNADRIRRDFVANASHELRTPLTAIRGFAETLNTGTVTDSETQTRFLQAILRHALRLEQLSNDLTQLAQAESPDQDYPVENVNLQEVCRRSLASVETSARKYQITFDFKCPKQDIALMVSGRALEHVLINLIENAVKYSGDSKKVLVKLTDHEEHAEVQVRDWGIGIPVKYQERIFERFYRVDKGRSRDMGGTGLGLAIVRHLVQRLEGSIELESEVGEGTTFTLKLPKDLEDESLM